MATRISKSHKCDLCGWQGQQVKLLEDGYGEVAVVVCVTAQECADLTERAAWMNARAEEAAEQDAYEAGNPSWAI